jgi:gas vesicle protein GvpL/GvpF
MSQVYVYAILGERPVTPLGSGIADEPLTLVTGGDLVAAVGVMDAAPDATRHAVLGHDAVVRRLAEASTAILPARFGMIHEASALVDWLATAADGLRDALRLVAGREQMTLHVFELEEPVVEAAGEAPDEDDAETAPGPGTRYLTQRRRQRREAAVPELAPLRARLGGLIAAERIERRTTPPFRASVYHLVERGRSAAYRDAVESNRDLVRGVRLRVSGPWAPYAFAPEAVA